MADGEYRQTPFWMLKVGDIVRRERDGEDREVVVVEKAEAFALAHQRKYTVRFAEGRPWSGTAHRNVWRKEGSQS